MEILVAEDDPVSGMLLKKLLGKQGHEVVYAPDGRRAWELFQENKSRMVITDWMMPEMDGPTFCGKIRNLNLPEYTYIILLTAKGDKEDTVRGLEAGADDFIVKPFDAGELNARISVGQRVIGLEDRYADSQRQLLQSEKMASVGQLAAGVAHEINNPVGFISSNLGSLKTYVDDMDDIINRYHAMATVFAEAFRSKQFPKNMGAIIKAALAVEEEYDLAYIREDIVDLLKDCSDGTERVQKIVHEMRYFAHQEQQVYENIALDALIEPVLQGYKSEIGDQIQLTTTLDEGLTVRCNPPHMEEVFRQLMRNAVEAMPEGGKLSIEARLETDQVHVVVSDTGAGIPEENIGKIFDPFYTTKSVGSGTGMGLNTVYNIITVHGGTISAASTPGEGTALTIQLPLAR